ncbi:MAG: FHA domain-containing protein [Chloroflexota bacterium]
MAARHHKVSDIERQIMELSPSELDQAIASIFTHDATVNIEAKTVTSKFKWGDAINSNSTRLMLNIRDAKTPVILQIEDELILGRLTESTKGQQLLDLTPFGGNEKGVSRKHAALRRMKSNLYIVDLGSTNKTYLNGERLVSNELHILMKGDEIRLGNLSLTITYAPAKPGSP